MLSLSIPKPIVGIVKGCKVECDSEDLKNYGEDAKVIVVSENLYSDIIQNLGNMEEYLRELKELDIGSKVEQMEKMTRDIETRFKALSYHKYLGEDLDKYLE